MKSIKLGSKLINQKSNPYFIAEIGVNHEGSMKLAKKMIIQAKSAGLNAVKFQTYKAENLVIKKSPAYWDTKKEKTKSQFSLFKKFDKFNKSNYLNLHKYCKKNKIDFLTTPFDVESILWLKNIMPAIKIASADINNFPLLRQIGSTKKKVFLEESDFSRKTFARVAQLFSTKKTRVRRKRFALENVFFCALNENVSRV